MYNQISDRRAAGIGSTQVALCLINGASFAVNIFAPSGSDDGAFFPASDINIYGKDAITQLRDFLTASLERFHDLHNPKSALVAKLTIEEISTPDQLNKNLSP